MRKQKQNAKIVVTNYADLEDYTRQYQKLYRQERARLRGEAAPPPRPKLTEEEKQEAHRERSRKYYEEMRSNLEWRKETNRKNAEYKKTKPHYKTKTRVYKQVSRLKQRIAVLSHYGVNGKPVCRHCGFDDVRALSIDHVHNNGAEHRKSGLCSEIYVWLERNDFPDGFQTLCRNCNWIKEYERKATVVLADLDEALLKLENMPAYNPHAPRFCRLHEARFVGRYEI